MVYTADVRDWLKTLSSADHYSIGKIDNRLDKSIGVYALNAGGYPVRTIGQDSTYTILSVSILLHWSKDAKTSEQAARQLFEALRTAESQTINGHKIYLLDLLTPDPVFVGTDEKGVYEWVVECSIYYERK